MIQLSTKIIQLIKPVIDLRLKQKSHSYSSIPIDVFRKLNLEPIEELTNENEPKKMTTSVSTTQIYGHFQNKKPTVNRARCSQIPTSKTCHSNFLLDIKSDNYDYIDDDYSTTDPLVKCYHRHIREHIATMFVRYTHLNQIVPSNEPKIISSMITEGKALIVAGHKLVFVLETLHEHVRHATKTQQTSLVQLTRQLCDALTKFIRILKQLTQQNTATIQHFQSDTQTIMNTVKKIKQLCNSA